MIPGWTHLRTGKVRDLYSNDKKEILLVASDRISAYDWVMPTTIPGKGSVLTQLSLFWFELLEDIIGNHIVSTDVPAIVEDRAVIVQPLTMFEVECVARGYLTGSGWSEYQSNKEVCGNALPDGLLDGSELPESIFTPATKAEIGDHDINIDFDAAAAIVGAEDAAQLRNLTIKLYETASEFAASRGIIVADTKFEFGRNENGQIILGDEALTPDSSRFWEASTWKPGGAQPSYDKQFLRDYLVASGWDRNSPPPELPQEIVEKTALRYEEAFFRITGSKF
jgi:phosphoribosylaminoimidazole-succinocarboxamide synthase